MELATNVLLNLMNFKQPFVRRILIAFVLMTIIVSGAFSIGIVIVVHYVEENLMSDSLQSELQTILREDIGKNRPPRLHVGTYFYASNLPQYAIPERYKNLSTGFTELVNSEGAFYVLVRRDAHKTVMLLQKQDEFEAREQALFKVVLMGFILSVASAWGIGLLMAGKVIAPIRRLAQQVRHRDQLHKLAPPLAVEYSKDEIGQLAEAFDNTLGQIRQSLERERLFTSDVSHELRTPLMIIATSCELLLAEADLTERERVQIERISRATDDMRQLVQTFLQLARDHDSAEAINHSLLYVANEQVEYWQPQFHAKQLAFYYKNDTADDTTPYSAVFLSTVISNLLRNSLHYTEKGFVRLQLGVNEFSIEDSGSGIPVEQQDAIFRPFFRGPQARGEGLGLGLSLVKRICNKQGWTISVHQRPEGGTRFTVMLKNTH